MHISILYSERIHMEELAKNQIHTVVITGYNSEGFGVCRVAGRAVFVPRALVGETWEIKIVKIGSSAVYARGEKLLVPSPARTEPDCPVFGKCGGCDLWHMSYEEELKFKLGRVNDALRHIGGLDFQVAEILGADKITGYRNKAIYAVGGTARNPVTGFYRSRSHDIVPIERCLIQPELSDRVAAAVRSWMAEAGVEPYDEKTGKGAVRHVFARCAFKTGQAMACVVSARGFGKNTSTLVDALRQACPELTSIILNINKTRGNTVLAGDFYTLWGSDTVSDELCGLRFELSPLSFFQINPPQAEKLYNKALEYASPEGTETVLDLYCGTGTITLCMARGAKKAYGAEIVEAAVQNARKNAEANNIENAEFILGDAGAAAKSLADRGVRPDAVVVDPPRKGLSREVIDEICRMSPERVVYVSCDPGTLARDLKIFSGQGYSLRSASAVDMFPRTAHVETVVLMSRL